MTTREQWLQDSWHSLMDRIGAFSNEDEVLQDLIVRYGEPHRHYHTLDHIADCLVTLAGVRHLCANPDTVALAIWFHDAIFDVSRNDNEELSAQLAYDSCLRLGLQKEIALCVSNLVKATTHQEILLTHDAKVLVDIDLTSLALDPDAFAENSRKIRSEYSSLDDGAYERRSRKMFEAMIDRHRIYQTDYFHEQYEDMARANLLATLLNLNLFAA